MAESQQFLGWKQYSMEPVAFALTFAYSICDNVYTDLIIYQTCKTITGLNSSECDILHENSTTNRANEIEKLVQPHTGSIFILDSCIKTIFPTLMALFLGPWSDKNGRKPLLIVPFLGYALSYAILALMSNFNLSPYWFLLSSIPGSVLGGFPTICLTFWSYKADITDSQNRAWHLACLETFFFGGFLGGLFVGPYTFRHAGYMVVFLIASASCLSATIYSVFLVPETIQIQHQRALKDVFDYKLVRDLFKAVLKSRDGFDKFLVWSCVLSIAINVSIMEGNGSILFLFTSYKLQWNLSDVSIYSSTNLLLTIIGMLLLIKLVGSILKLPETVIVVLSCLSTSISCLGKAFVSKPYHMYITAGIGMFSASAVPAIRSIVSKTVPQDDLGKTFSVITIVEMIIPFAATPLYLYIYTHTLDMFPCPVWFLSASLPIVNIILAIMIEYRWKVLKNTQYSEIVTERD
ncbi:hypothetical protein TKK_0009241 [Trichogramma kaykai]